MEATKESKTHTHEIRRSWYEKGKSGTKVVCEGSEKDCEDFLKEESKKSGFGVGFLINNGGYERISLEEERINKIKKAAVDLYESAKQAASYLQTINCGDQGDQALQSLTAAVFKAENDATAS